ncbi:MAG: hypothetical protein HKO84_09300 [Pseudomonadales bacterium]|nr:hypothetical protein [Pseudomonadales bacterium]
MSTPHRVENRSCGAPPNSAMSTPEGVATASLLSRRAYVLVGKKKGATIVAPKPPKEDGGDVPTTLKINLVVISVLLTTITFKSIAVNFDSHIIGNIAC